MDPLILKNVKKTYRLDKVDVPALIYRTVGCFR
jgi:hypothetical protein